MRALLLAPPALPASQGQIEVLEWLCAPVVLLLEEAVARGLGEEEEQRSQRQSDGKCKAKAAGYAEAEAEGGGDGGGDAGVGEAGGDDNF